MPQHRKFFWNRRCFFELYWRALSHFPLLESFRGSWKLHKRKHQWKYHKSKTTFKNSKQLCQVVYSIVSGELYKERQVMEATVSSYMPIEWNRCCKLNRQKIWDANLKTCGNYSDLVTLSLTRMKTPRNYLICAESWRSCRSPTQFSKILWLISSVCSNVVSGTSILLTIIMFSTWILDIPMPSANVLNAPKLQTLFEGNERKNFKFDPNLFSFIDENAQFVLPIHYQLKPGQKFVFRLRRDHARVNWCTTIERQFRPSKLSFSEKSEK